MFYELVCTSYCESCAASKNLFFHWKKWIWQCTNVRSQRPHCRVVRDLHKPHM